MKTDYFSVGDVVTLRAGVKREGCLFPYPHCAYSVVTRVEGGYYSFDHYSRGGVKLGFCDTCFIYDDRTLMSYNLNQPILYTNRQSAGNAGVNGTPAPSLAYTAPAHSYRLNQKIHYDVPSLDHTFYFGIDIGADSPTPSPSIFMSVWNYLKDKVRPADDKELMKANFLNDCGDLNSFGKDALIALLYQDYKPKLVALAKEMNEEEVKKKNNA